MGLYTVTVVDANGCNKADVFNVGQATALTGFRTFIRG